MYTPKIKIIGIALTLIGVGLLFGGCAGPLPLNYAPSSVLTATGSASVEGFKYTPAIEGKVKPNQIRNTAVGSALFDQNIDTFFKDAVFKELRFVGVKLDNQNKVLTGDIQEFLIDDLGYHVDWTIRVRYILTDKTSGTVVYDSVKTTIRKTSKFANVFGALNETIKLNVEEILKDSAFTSAIK